MEEVKGLTGLTNLGNTCYINSCMQVLSNLHTFNEYIEYFLKNTNIEEEDINVLFLKEWFDLRELMWKKNVVISPVRFIRVIQIIAKMKDQELFSAYEQNDVTEFLYFLLECFHEGMKKHDKYLEPKFFKGLNEIYPKKYCENIKCATNDDFSFINVLFQGIFVHDMVDESSKKRLSRRFEPFRMLDVTLHSTDLNECIKQYFEAELFNEENENQYYDEDREVKVDAMKKTKIYYLPNILFIHLKRWNNQMKKNLRIIHYPCDDLDLSNYVVKELKQKSVCKYDLLGAINHSGNIFGGHYTSFLKNGNKKWYHYNDCIINELPEKNIKSNKNYVLVYKMQSNTDTDM